VKIVLDSYFAFVKRLVCAFEDVKLDYALTGALAASFYGVPRTTTDVDLVIAVTDETEFRSKVAAALKQAGLEIDERKIENALLSGYGIATFRCKTSPYTVDIIFSNSKLDKRAGIIDSLKTSFQSPESLIAAKLRMIKATLPPERAMKDKEDIKAILAFTTVDVETIKRQAQKDKTLKIFKDLISI
jgi:hypothetical protein